MVINASPSTLLIFVIPNCRSILIQSEREYEYDIIISKFLIENRLQGNIINVPLLFNQNKLWKAIMLDKRCSPSQLLYYSQECSL
jgi:hypothetical protein